jgi:exopolysaccharide biosynthesis polyprenyl glycosylphosphotransferase
MSSYYREFEYKPYERRMGSYSELYKRVLDILLALAGLIIGIPIMLVFGIAIIADSPGPAIYTQERVGKFGKIFTIYKLRSMRLDAEKDGAQWAQQNDPRVTRVGAFIRKARIDEIPQILNILKGDMSIIGPRPERPNFTLVFNEDIPGYIHRLQVKPGLTGLAQVTGGYEMTPKQKLEVDMYYIKNRNFLMDLRIIFNTVKIVFTGKGAR